MSRNPDPKHDAPAAAGGDTATGEQPKLKKKIQRLRTGCWTCRRRGYKCDEGKPHCKNCTRLNLNCEGYGIRLKWQEDRLSPSRKNKKGPSASTSVKSRNSRPQSSSRLASPITFESYQPNAPQQSPEMTPVASTPSVPMSVGNTPLSASPLDSPYRMQPQVQSYQYVPQQQQHHHHHHHQQQQQQQQVPPSLSSLDFASPSVYESPYQQHRQQQQHMPHVSDSSLQVTGSFNPVYEPRNESLLDAANFLLSSWSSDVPQLPPPPPPSSLVDPEYPLSTAVSSRADTYNSTPASLPSPSSSSLISNSSSNRVAYEGVERLLINHFENVLAYDLNPLEAFSSNNVFRDVIVPQYHNNPAVRYAICGFSARHMSQLHPEYISLSVEFKVEALKALREGLKDHRPFDLPALASVLVLAVQECYESNFDIWKKHVRGAVRGALEGGKNSLFHHSGHDFGLRYMCYYLEYHDTTLSLLSNHPPMLADYTRNTWFLTDADPGDNAFVASLGPIYRAVSGIAKLATNVNYNSAPEALQMAQVGTMPYAFTIPHVSRWETKYGEKRIELQVQLNMWSPMEGMGTGDMLSTTRILKIAADLYFHMRLDRDEFGVELSPRVKRLVRDGLDALQKVSLQAGSSVLHAWPLWQLGVACEEDSDQQLILSRLEQLKWKTNKLSLQSIIDYLRLLWHLRSDIDHVGLSYRELLAVTMQRSLPVILL